MITIKTAISVFSNIESMKLHWLQKLSGSTDSESNILKLHTPQIIYTDNTKIGKEKTSLNQVSDVLADDMDSIIVSRTEKKNKNYNKSLDTLESRKNKNKTKKKSRTKIHINDEDDNLATSYSGFTKDDTNLEFSLMRPAKPLKKKTSIKSNIVIKADKKNPLKSKNNTSLLPIKKNKPEVISLPDTISIEELANLLVIPAAEIIKSLFLKGISVTINQFIDKQIATLVAENYSIQVKKNIEDSLSQRNTHKQLDNADKHNEILEFRAPIVTIFGHVDHGKTTLLNALCKHETTLNEAGGITQAIVAYEVPTISSAQCKKIIFLDTPGHEAFSGMRMRGVQVTDIGILVVAADDGLKPQTIEAIEYLQNDNLPFIIAINKVDKQEANLTKIMEELSTFNIISTQWGGDVPVIEVSALKNINLDIILATIIDLTEKNKLQAYTEESATGTILDAYLDKQKGPIANVLIQNGTLHNGDYFMSSGSISKIRSIVGKNNIKIDNVGPSSVVKVSGLGSIPNAGNVFEVIKDEKLAKKKLADIQKNKDSKYKLNHKLNTRITFDSSQKLKENTEIKKVNIILKTDTEGTIEAIISAFSRIPDKKVQINLVAVGVGEITESDINLAVISQSAVISFNSIISLQSELLASKSNIIISDFNVIYDLIEYVEKIMLELVDIDYAEKIIGKAIVENVFIVSKGNVAGCMVISGKLKRNAYIRVKKKDDIIYDGELTSLKRVKEDVEEISAGNECGVLCKTFDAWQKKYEIEAYEKVELDKTL